ncbi:putative membrane protein insertion efficiency factor [Mycobacterium xenopi 4042]|uniref:Putative membrane protein insertion efficiency factor n=1 Tax=Mycobacterium xenopi 4042 TaxID=1299334 RepID=X8CKJ1_MYCXE|nr:putative membrane protein insertion efficiency factor [Mycobacterium xenopi 4042]
MVARGLIFLIQLYRHMISPLRPPTCRFIPTCSQYAVDALSEHGLVRGSWLALTRLAKCGPWHQGGWDPIPERGHSETTVPMMAGTPARSEGRVRPLFDWFSLDIIYYPVSAIMWLWYKAFGFVLGRRTSSPGRWR